MNGIKEAILCPGSRSAPLTLSFARNKGVNTRVIPDERSAAYIALGIAQRTKMPVALVCTSGTAVLNFAPAVAEAFYQQIPLVVLTADRPPEWVGQGDGQVINQQDIFGRNVKKSYTLPVDKTHKDSMWALQRTVNEGIAMSAISPMGPVHFNIPVREPLYPKYGENPKFDTEINIIKHFKSDASISKTVWNEVIGLLIQHPKKLIVVGHLLPDMDLKTVFNSFSDANSIPVLTDLNSNLQEAKHAISHFDQFLGNSTEIDQSLIPDLLISFGNDFLSKRLKNFVRTYRPKVHIQLLNNEIIVDTFMSITHTIKMPPSLFFNELQNRVKLNSDKAYMAQWKQLNEIVEKKLPEFVAKAGFGELSAVRSILMALTENTILHTSNSLPVRIASIITSKSTQNYCNRGTSGIDGCTSTSVGAAMVSKELVVLITGDVAFFYDRNALWHTYLPDNLRIVLLNNGGGNIFRTVEGAKDQPELEKYFVTNQTLTAKLTAREFGLDYFSVANYDELQNIIPKFLEISLRSKILEIHADGRHTAESLSKLTAEIKELINRA